MSFIIYYLECLIGRFFNHKIVSIVMIVTLFLLFGWCYDNADYEIYYTRFYFPEESEDMTEPLFNLFVLVCNSIGLDLQGFIQLVGLGFVIMLYRLVSTVTEDTSTTLALYMLSPLFFYDVVQVRFSCALIFVYLGFIILFKAQHELEEHHADLDPKAEFRQLLPSSIGFVVCILLATMVHFSCIVFLAYLLAVHLTTKRCFIVMGGLTAVLVLASQFFLDNLAAVPLIGEKLEAVQDMVDLFYEGTADVKINILTFLFNMSVFFFLYWLQQWRKNEYDERPEPDRFIDTVLRINMVSFITIPLMIFSVDFHRIYMAVLILNYAVYAKWLLDRRYAFITNAALIAYFVLYFYRILCMSINIETVFLSVMEKNLIFE